jgi:hypothetical protein
MTGNIKPDDAHYCPYCQRSILPERDEEDEPVTVDGGLVYVHDDVEHDEDYTFGKLQ